jgi:hypothetical protein
LSHLVDGDLGLGAAAPRPAPVAERFDEPPTCWVHAISWVRAMTGRLSWSLPSAGDGGEDSEIEDATEVVVGDEWSGTVELRREKVVSCLAVHARAR